MAFLLGCPMDQMQFVLDRLQKIEDALTLLVEQRTVKDWYTTAEVAKLLGRAEFTVREWCRLKRIRAGKKERGRGVASEWIISHDELVRIKNHGLLPSECGSHY